MFYLNGTRTRTCWCEQEHCDQCNWWNDCPDPRDD